MPDSTTVKPFIGNKESKLISLEMEMRATVELLLGGFYDEKERKHLETYKKLLTDQIMEITILGGK